MIALCSPKTDANIGSALRAVGVFGAEMMVISGKRYRKSYTDTRKQHKHTPFLQVEDLHKAVPYDCVPVAVEILEGAKPLPGYTHPERAFYIFGPEDSSLDESITSWCRDIICIPTNGECMNLAAAVNVVLYDRMAKRGY